MGNAGLDSGPGSRISRQEGGKTLVKDGLERPKNTIRMTHTPFFSYSEWLLEAASQELSSTRITSGMSRCGENAGATMVESVGWALVPH